MKRLGFHLLMLSFLLLLLGNTHLLAQEEVLTISSFRYTGQFTQAEGEAWLKVADRWLEDDKDYNRFLIGQADFNEKGLT